MTKRIQRVNALLCEQVGKVLLAELRGGGGLLTVTRAEASPTLEHATIYISVLPEQQSRSVLAKIRQQIYFLQQDLNKRLNLRVVPKVRFELDRSAAHVSRIEQILEKTK